MHRCSLFGLYAGHDDQYEQVVHKVSTDRYPESASEKKDSEIAPRERVENPESPVQHSGGGDRIVVPGKRECR